MATHSYPPVMASKLIVFSCVLAAACASKFQVGYRSAGIDGGVAGRIIDGSDAVAGEFPHVISLQWGLSPILPLSHMCSGSILNESWILTAAHCLKGVPTHDLHVKASKLKINIPEQTEQTAQIEKNFAHNLYSGNAGPYDIALLKLEAPLKFNKYVQSIHLPKPDSIPHGDATLSGWGSISADKIPKMPNTLQKAKLPLLDNVTCQSRLLNLTGGTPFHHTNICTGPVTSLRAACFGDAGDPLIQTNEDGEPELVGMVSWGIIPCAAPSVYTRVSAHIDWIETTIAHNS